MKYYQEQFYDTCENCANDTEYDIWDAERPEDAGRHVNDGNPCFESAKRRPCFQAYPIPYGELVG